MQTVDEIVRLSVENTNRFPDLSTILNAINENNELDFRFKTNLITNYVKKDEDLLQVVKLMLSKNFEFNKFDIFDLAKNGYFKTMEYFSSIGFNLNVKNLQNENALFYVLQNDVSRYNYIDGWWRTNDYINIIVDNCISLGIDEKIINNQGRNLFHAFILAGMPINYFNALAHLDLDINQQDINGWTPLHCACAYYSDLELYKLLLYFGADKTILTKRSISNYGEDYDIESTSEICSAYDLALHQISSWTECGENDEKGILLREEFIKNLKP